MTKKSKDVRLKQLLRLGICVALIALIALIGVVMASAEEPEYSEGLKFTSNGDGTCYVSGTGTCKDTDIRIPSVSPDGDTVTGIDTWSLGYGMESITIPQSVVFIGESVFSSCDELVRITVEDGNRVYHSDGNCLIETAMKTLVRGCQTSVIPNDGSVMKIGDRAFSECHNLTAIIIPSSVTDIGVGAFEDCRALTGMIIPKSVTDIGEMAFGLCPLLTELVVEEGNPVYHSDGNCVIETATKTLVFGCMSSTIPADGSVTSIGDYAFYYTGIKPMDIPEGITRIGVCAFQFSHITDISLPESLERIEAGAFEFSYLHSVEIPKNVTHIGAGAFCGLERGLTLIIPEDSKLSYIGSLAFYDTCLDRICIPKGVTYIGDSAFALTRLNEIEFAENSQLKEIGQGAFQVCNAVHITLPAGVTHIGDHAFYMMGGLISITLPVGLKSIGQGAFDDCNFFAHIYYKGTEADWKEVAIDRDNEHLFNATIHYNTTLDENGILYTSNGDGTCSVSGIGTCTDTEIVIPATSPEGDRVIAIGDFAFVSQKNLIGITIPEGVTSIGFLAFEGCSNLEYVRLPDSIVSIGNSAFDCCYRLTDVTIPTNVKEICPYAFYSTGIESIHIPKGVTSIGFAAFAGTDNLKRITVDQENQIYHSKNNCLIDTASKTLVAGCTNSSIPTDGSVSSIGKETFRAFETMQYITIPKSVICVMDWAFYECKNLKDVYYAGTKAEWDMISIRARNDEILSATIHYNTTLDENGILYTSNGDGTCYVSGHMPSFRVDVVIPSVSPAGDTVTAIGEDAFAFANIKSVQLPDTLKLIGSDAFSWNNSLLEVSIPASVTYIGVHAFGSCEILCVVDIPANSQLTCIDTQAFYYCYDLSDIIIPETVTSIGASAFAFCHVDAVIPKSVTYIGDYAFQYTSNVTFAPDSPLTEIGEGVFKGCHTRYFILPSNIKTIGDYAFQGCNSQGFFFPAGLTEIGYAAFDAEGAIWFYYEGTEEAWNKITIGEKNEALLGTPDKYFLGDSFFTGASLTLGESLTMNYYSTLESVFGQATVRFTYRGETFTVKGVRDKESGEYVFSLKGITPQCMGENIKAELIFTVAGAEWILDTKETYSVREYCDDALAANPNNEVLATLLADLLAYGDASQDYANYNEETPAGDGFEVAPSQWEAVTDTDLTLSDKTSDTVYFAAAGVRFDYINRVYFKIKAADLTGVTLTVNGKTYTADDLILVENTADTYVLYTDAVYATEFDKVFTAKLALNGEELQTVTYSVRSYVYTKQNSNDTELAALVRALYNYGRSAIAYKNAQ